MAGRSLGVLTLDLIAKTSNFEQGMDRASRRTRSTTSEFEKAAAAAQKMALAAGAAAAAFAASSAAIVMNAAKAMDATSKMAQQIGVTTEALTGMRFAAQQFSSISDQQFDQAMRRMTRRIEEAAAGSGAAKKALEEMGLSARELSRMTPDRQMLALADAMKRTESQANRLRYTMAIFDTEGMALVPALQQGAAAFEENIKLAERYGVVLSTEAAQAAEQFNTNMSHLGSMLDGLKIQLASEVLPTINSFISNVIQAATEVDGLHSEVQSLSGNSAFKAWFEASLVGLARVADVAVFLAKAIGVVGGAFRSVAADAEVALAAINKAQAWNWFSDEATNELQAALAKRNQIVGGFNKELADLFTYQGNRFEQAALSAINTVRIQSDEVKLVDLTTRDLAESTSASTAATKRNSSALTEAQRAAQNFRREQDQSLRSQLQSVSAIHDQAQALEDQIAVYGLGKTAIEDLNIARLEEQATILRSFEGSQEQVEAIEREIEARQRLRTAIGSLEQKEAERQAWEDWARDVEQIFDRVGQSLTDAIFEGGKSGKDLLKDIFKSLTFNVLINPVMQGMQGWVTNTLGGALGGQGGGGIAGLVQNASTLYSAVTGGLTSSLAAGAASIGSAIGSSALTSFAAGMKGSTLAAGLAGPTTAGATGAMGLGATVGAALPWIGGGLAIASIIGGGLFDREPTTRRQQRSIAEYMNGAFSTGGANSEAAQAAKEMAQSAVEAANDIFSRVGVDAAIDSFYAILETSYKRDRDGVASGGRVRIGDELRNIGIPWASDMTLAGFGGWSDVDIVPRLATDIQLTVLEAFQQVGNELPRVLSQMLAGVDIRGLDEAQATELAQRFSAVVQEVSLLQDALQTLPFAELRDISFDAATNMLEVAGGLENLAGGMQRYFELFHTQEEQLAFATENLSKSFGDFGLQLPDLTQGAEAAIQAYRQLRESLDLSTEEGQRANAMLFMNAESFYNLAVGLDELNAITEEVIDNSRELADIARERESLERQLLAFQGDTEELRRRDLALLHESNRELQERIWGLQDEAKATAEAEQARQDALQAQRDEYDRLVRAAQYGLQGAVSQMQTAFTALRTHAQEQIRQLQDTFRGTDSAMDAYRSAVQGLESEFEGLFDSIEGYINQLRGGVDAASRMQYEQARAVISTALVTGSLPQTARLSEALRIAQEGVTSQVYASREDQERAYLRLANEMEAVKELAEPELDAAQATLREIERQYNELRGISNTADASLSTLERQLSTALATEANARVQIAGIEAQLGIAEAQYNALMGIDSSITDLSSAMRAFAAAVSNVREAQSNPVNRDQRYYESKLDHLRRAGSTTGGIDWTKATASDLAAYFRSIGLTPEGHWKQYGRYEGLSYDVGTSYVPRDMMANIHKGEIIIDPRSSDILRRYGIEVQGGNSQALERRMERVEGQLEKTNQYLYQITKETKRTALNTEDTAMAVAHGESDLLVVGY